MLVNRKNNNGVTSVLQVTLTQHEVFGKDPALTLKIRNRLADMSIASDSKFALVCEDGQDLVFGSFSNDPQKLKDAVTQALVDMRAHLNPKKASDVFTKALLPPGLAQKISML